MPCVVNAPAGGPGHSGYVAFSRSTLTVGPGNTVVDARSAALIRLSPPVPAYTEARTHWPPRNATRSSGVCCPQTQCVSALSHGGCGCDRGWAAALHTQTADKIVDTASARTAFALAWITAFP